MFPTLILSQTFVSQSIFYNLFKHSNFDGLYDPRPLEESALRQKWFPVFIPNTGKYEPEKTLYLDNFHAVQVWNLRKEPRGKLMEKPSTE